MEVSALIAGGGFYGCGLAAAIPGSLLVDEKNVPGGDFTLALAPCRNWREPEHPAAKRFYEELKRRKAFTETGLFRTAAAAPELAAWLIGEKVELRLGTVVEKAETPDTYYLYNCDGKTVVHAPKFYDLRTMGQEKPVKSWRVLITACSGTLEHCTLETAAQEGYSWLTLELPQQCTYPEARKTLLEIWQARPDSMRDARIAWSAPYFDYGCFDNPVQALDCGLEAGR